MSGNERTIGFVLIVFGAFITIQQFIQNDSALIFGFIGLLLVVVGGVFTGHSGG